MKPINALLQMPLPSYPQGYFSRGRRSSSGIARRRLGMPDDLPDGFTGSWYVVSRDTKGPIVGHIGKCKGDYVYRD